MLEEQKLLDEFYNEKEFKPEYSTKRRKKKEEPINKKIPFNLILDQLKITDEIKKETRNIYLNLPEIVKKDYKSNILFIRCLIQASYNLKTPYDKNFIIKYLGFESSKVTEAYKINYEDFSDGEFLESEDFFENYFQLLGMDKKNKIKILNYYKKIKNNKDFFYETDGKYPYIIASGLLYYIIVKTNVIPNLSVKEYGSIVYKSDASVNEIYGICKKIYD